jgi:hypothetical protein
MFVHTLLQTLNRNHRYRQRKLVNPLYPDRGISEARNVRAGLLWFLVVVLLALSFALI